MPGRVSRLRACLASSLMSLPLVAGLAGPAAAQPREPIPWFAVDAQGALPKLPTSDALAADRGLAAAALPAWGPGFNVAAHVFPLRTKWVTFGVGANYQWARGTYTPDIPEGATTASGPSVTTAFRSFAPQVSFNFGHRRGWSYISTGLGGATLTVSRDDLPEETGEAIKTINWGGGGRWFVKEHLAFSFDFRVYAMNPAEPSEFGAGHPRLNVVVLNLGVSFQ